MANFGFPRRRKIHHRLFFDQKNTDKSSMALHKRMSIFVTEAEHAGLQKFNCDTDKNDEGNIHKPKEDLANGEISRENDKVSQTDKKVDHYIMPKRPPVVWDEEELRWKKKKTPQEMAERRKEVVETLKRRRNAVCREIERTWFLQGGYLEKHRHNLLVTHDLTERGLLVWW